MKHSLALLLLSGSCLWASIGEITAIRGEAELIRNNTHEAIYTGTALEPHDRIVTHKATRLQIRFKDNTIISLGQNSQFRIDTYLYGAKEVAAKFSIRRGFFKSITGKIGKIAPSHFKLKTANATIGVRGTTIIGETAPSLDIIACTYGQIEVASSRGAVIVNAGERTIVRENSAPLKAEKVNRILLQQLDRKSDPTTSGSADAVSPTEPHRKPVAQQTREEEKEQRWSGNTQDDRKAVEIVTHEPSLDDIQRVTGSATPVYRGSVVEGETSYGTIHQDAGNSVRLGFDLGAGSMQGKMQFQDDRQAYDIDVAGRIRADGSFDFNSQNGYDGGGNGKIEGVRYEKADGSFRFQEHDLQNGSVTNRIEGRFETERE